MRMFMIPAMAVTIATGFTGVAHAADRATENFFYRVQSDAAFDGIEVSRIQRRGNLVLVHGEDRQGRTVVIQRHCGQQRLECPPIGVASREPSERPRAIMSLGGGARSYHTGR